ncbi:hypothetical protein R80B4_01114 [Fibrobacteres bacterium R8-0-B4]
MITKNNVRDGIRQLAVYALAGLISCRNNDPNNSPGDDDHIAKRAFQIAKEVRKFVSDWTPEDVEKSVYRSGAILMELIRRRSHNMNDNPGEDPQLAKRFFELTKAMDRAWPEFDPFPGICPDPPYLN